MNKGTDQNTSPQPERRVNSAAKQAPRSDKQTPGTPRLNMEVVRQKIKEKPEFEQFMLEMFSESLKADRAVAAEAGPDRRENCREQNRQVPNPRVSRGMLSAGKTKSPSDTMIYRPALKLKRFDNEERLNVDLKSPQLKVQTPEELVNRKTYTTVTKTPYTAR